MPQENKCPNCSKKLSTTEKDWQECHGCGWTELEQIPKLTLFNNQDIIYIPEC